MVELWAQCWVPPWCNISFLSPEGLVDLETFSPSCLFSEKYVVTLMQETFHTWLSYSICERLWWLQSPVAEGHTLLQCSGKGCIWFFYGFIEKSWAHQSLNNICCVFQTVLLAHMTIPCSLSLLLCIDYKNTKIIKCINCQYKYHVVIAFSFGFFFVLFS